MLNLGKIANNKNEDEDWPFRMLIIGPSGSGKTNTLLHLINNLLNLLNMHFYAFIEYSNDMNDVYENINNYNKNRDKKVLIVFDDMITDIEYNKNFTQIIKELLYRAHRINVSIVFITQFYLRVLKDARLNSTLYILMKIGNKRELKSIAEEKSGNLDYKDFLKMHNYFTSKLYSLMTIGARPNSTTVFRKIFTELHYKNDQK